MRGPWWQKAHVAEVWGGGGAGGASDGHQAAFSIFTSRASEESLQAPAFHRWTTGGDVLMNSGHSGDGFSPTDAGGERFTGRQEL